MQMLYSHETENEKSEQKNDTDLVKMLSNYWFMVSLWMEYFYFLQKLQSH